MAFEIENGVLVKYIPEKEEKIVTVPEGVTAIQEWQGFHDVSEIEKVILPKSLKKIGVCSFKDCSLKEVVLPDGLEEIGLGAFESANLEKVHIPDSVTECSWSVFERCYALKEVIVPNHWQIIPKEFCSCCGSLEQFTFPEKTERIGEFAFTSCTNLKEIHLPETVETIYQNAFCQCESLVSVRIPANELFYGAFNDCKNLKSVEFTSEEVSHIARRCFIGCALQEVTLPPLKKLGDEAFDPDVILHIQLPDGVFTMPFGTWKDNQDEKCVLAFLNQEDVYLGNYGEKRVDTREKIFQEIKSGYYKLLLANFMVQNHPEEELYQNYIKRNIKKAVKTLTDMNDITGVENLLKTSYVTKKNIDEFIRYAIDHQKTEIQVILMNWKNENVPAESIEKQVQKKFKL